MKDLIKEAIELAEIVKIMTEGNKHLHKNYTEKLRNILYEIQDYKSEENLKRNLFFFFTGCFFVLILTYLFVI